MIEVNFDEACPHCHEEVILQLDDGDREAEYTCECGAYMEFAMSAKVEMTWSKGT